jgi:hypothetical protein
MSDEFLHGLREEPRAEFADELERRLRAIEMAERERASRPLARLRPALAGGLALLALAAAFVLPPVRAAAREFLDLFRVQRVAAIPVDTERLARLEQGGLDLKGLVGSQVEVIDPAVAPQAVGSAEQAGALAGVAVLQPATLPRGASPAGVLVGRPGAFRVRLDVAKIRSLAVAVGAEDAQVPDAWQGAVLEVHASPVVALRYKRGESEFVLLQSRGPEVALPEAMDLAELGAVGLQLAGMSAGEARSFARNIDWRSTLLLPIPAQGGSFREVEVQGRKGVLVTSRDERRQSDGTTRPGRWRSVLLWADEDRVYALAGPGHGVEILEMAQSLG